MKEGDDTMTRATFLATALFAVAATSFGAMGFASPEAKEADCPGKIVCPITGDLVCRDKCPRVDMSRLDCPGRIECPVDGQLICKDSCPVGKPVNEELPPCCSADK
jgi:hypothetical protein